MFILTADLRDADLQQQRLQWAAYESYLEGLKGLIPPAHTRLRRRIGITTLSIPNARMMLGSNLCASPSKAAVTATSTEHSRFN